MHAEDIIQTFLTSNIYIGLYLVKALTLPRDRFKEIFEVLLVVTMNNSVRLRGILDIPLVGDPYLYWLARGFPLKEGVP